LNASLFFFLHCVSNYIILGRQVMRKTAKELLRAHLSKLGKRGGVARATKYDAATLSKWARKGGRPPKKGKGKADGR
jgi:hypothetical protein